MTHVANTVEVEKPHSRVTARRGREGAVFGMHAVSAVTQVGVTDHFRVSCLTSLGTKGQTLATALLATCEKDFGTLQNAFGGITPKQMPFVVEVTADDSGASHSSCLGTDIAVGGNSGVAQDFIRSLLVAEADEVFMANFGHGWNCGASPGEGLSRVLANDMYPGVEPNDFLSASVWLDLNPRPNYIDYRKPTDTDYPSIGCSVLFLNWLHFELKHSWSDIIAAGGATLAKTYQGLTKKKTAWKDFGAMISARFPAGGNYDNLGTDNPFSE